MQKVAFQRAIHGLLQAKRWPFTVHPQFRCMEYKANKHIHPTVIQAEGNMFWRICNPPKSTIRICNPLKPHSHEVNVWACADCKSAIRNRRIANPAEQMLSLIDLVFHSTGLRMNHLLQIIHYQATLTAAALLRFFRSLRSHSQ